MSAGTYQEPTAEDERAGHVRYVRDPTPYEAFMLAQGIPIYRGIGLRDARDLPLVHWTRLGAEATFVQLDGMQGLWGMYVAQVPGGGALNPERHIYEEVFLVLEGRGTTEVWREGSAHKQIFEWQAGTLFSVPVNTVHRLVNATSSPALVIAMTNAPAVIDVFDDEEFVFNNPYAFATRYDESAEYFKVREELEPHPVMKRAMRRSSVLPDVTHTYLALDNNRAPGYRWVKPEMANNRNFSGFIAEYPVGRYSKAHAHQAGAVLICLRGQGYTYTWPVEAGIRPWESGRGALVKRQDYVPGGMVSAAPGGGNWFHQHFGVARDTFRVLAIWAGRPAQYNFGELGKEVTTGNVDIQEGGRSIRYADEDPHIRREYQQALAAEGAEFTMPESLYVSPDGRAPVLSIDGALP